MQWPARRFEAFYAAFVKRTVIEALERRKEGIIAAFWANDGMNDDKGTRTNAIQEVEANFDEAISVINGGAVDEVEIDKNNPFFSAMERGKTKLEIPSELSEENVKAVIEQEQDYAKYIDQ